MIVKSTANRVTNSYLVGRDPELQAGDGSDINQIGLSRYHVLM